MKSILGINLQTLRPIQIQLIALVNNNCDPFKARLKTDLFYWNLYTSTAVPFRTHYLIIITASFTEDFCNGSHLLYIRLLTKIKSLKANTSVWLLIGILKKKNPEQTQLEEPKLNYTLSKKEPKNENDFFLCIFCFICSVYWYWYMVKKEGMLLLFKNIKKRIHLKNTIFYMLNVRIWKKTK